MFCPNCGLENAPDARFCNGCGTKLAADVMSPMPSGEETVRADAARSAQYGEETVCVDTANESTFLVGSSPTAEGYSVSTQPDASERTDIQTQTKHAAIIIVAICAAAVLISGSVVAGILLSGLDEKAEYITPRSVDIKAISDGMYLPSEKSYWTASEDGNTYRLYYRDTLIEELEFSKDSFDTYLYSPDTKSILICGADLAYLVKDGEVKTLPLFSLSDVAMSDDASVIYAVNKTGVLNVYSATDNSCTKIDTDVTLPGCVTSPDGSALLYHKKSGAALELTLFADGKSISLGGGFIGLSVSNGADTIYATDLKGGLYAFRKDGTSTRIGDCQDALKNSYTNADRSGLLLCGEGSAYITENGAAPTYAFTSGDSILESVPRYARSSGSKLTDRLYCNNSPESGDIYYLSDSMQSFKLCSAADKCRTAAPDTNTFCYVSAESGALIRITLSDGIPRVETLVKSGVSSAYPAPDGTLWYLTDVFSLHCISDGTNTAVANNVYSFDIAHDGTVFYDTWNKDKHSGELWCASSTSNPVLVDKNVNSYICLDGYTAYKKELDPESGRADIYVSLSGNRFDCAAEDVLFEPLSQ